MMTFGRLIEASELISAVDAVTEEDVRVLASRSAASKPSVAIVGAPAAHAAEHGALPSGAFEAGIETKAAVIKDATSSCARR